MSEIGKPFLKKSDQKKKMKINVKMPLVSKKTVARKGNLFQTKNKAWNGILNALEKKFRKKI